MALKNPFEGWFKKKTQPRDTEDLADENEEVVDEEGDEDTDEEEGDEEGDDELDEEGDEEEGDEEEESTPSKPPLGIDKKKFKRESRERRQRNIALPDHVNAQRIDELIDSWAQAYKELKKKPKTADSIARLIVDIQNFIRKEIGGSEAEVILVNIATDIETAQNRGTIDNMLYRSFAKLGDLNVLDTVLRGKLPQWVDTYLPTLSRMTTRSLSVRAALFFSIATGGALAGAAISAPLLSMGVAAGIGAASGWFGMRSLRNMRHERDFTTYLGQLQKKIATSGGLTPEETKEAGRALILGAQRHGKVLGIKQDGSLDRDSIFAQILIDYNKVLEKEGALSLYGVGLEDREQAFQSAVETVLTGASRLELEPLDTLIKRPDGVLRIYSTAEIQKAKDIHSEIKVYLRIFADEFANPANNEVREKVNRALGICEDIITQSFEGSGQSEKLQEFLEAAGKADDELSVDLDEATDNIRQRELRIAVEELRNAKNFERNMGIAGAVLGVLFSSAMRVGFAVSMRGMTVQEWWNSQGGTPINNVLKNLGTPQEWWSIFVNKDPEAAVRKTLELHSGYRPSAPGKNMFYVSDEWMKKEGPEWKNIYARELDAGTVEIAVITGPLKPEYPVLLTVDEKGNLIPGEIKPVSEAAAAPAARADAAAPAARADAAAPAARADAAAPAVKAEGAASAASVTGEKISSMPEQWSKLEVLGKHLSEEVQKKLASAGGAHERGTLLNVLGNLEKKGLISIEGDMVELKVTDTDLEAMYQKSLARPHVTADAYGKKIKFSHWQEWFGGEKQAAPPEPARVRTSGRLPTLLGSEENERMQGTVITDEKLEQADKKVLQGKLKGLFTPEEAARQAEIDRVGWGQPPLPPHPEKAITPPATAAPAIPDIQPKSPVQPEGAGKVVGQVIEGAASEGVQARPAAEAPAPAPVAQPAQAEIAAQAVDTSGKITGAAVTGEGAGARPQPATPEQGAAPKPTVGELELKAYQEMQETLFRKHGILPYAVDHTKDLKVSVFLENMEDIAAGKLKTSTFGAGADQVSLAEYQKFEKYLLDRPRTPVQNDMMLKDYLLSQEK